MIGVGQPLRIGCVLIEQYVYWLYLLAVFARDVTG